eukprot:3140328-Prymnesium_polylepis.2
MLCPGAPHGIRAREPRCDCIQSLHGAAADDEGGGGARTSSRRYGGARAMPSWAKGHLRRGDACLWSSGAMSSRAIPIGTVVQATIIPYTNSDFCSAVDARWYNVELKAVLVRTKIGELSSVTRTGRGRTNLRCHGLE